METLPKSYQEMQTQLAELYARLQDDSSPESASWASREILALLDATFAWIENPEISEEISAIYEKLPMHLKRELRSTETQVTARAHRLMIEDLRTLKNELNNSPMETMVDLVIMRIFGLTSLFFAVNPGTMLQNILAAKGERASGGSSKGGTTRVERSRWWQQHAQSLFDADQASMSMSGEALARKYLTEIAAMAPEKPPPKHRSLVTFILGLKAKK
jgi:hypothetical protein